MKKKGKVIQLPTAETKKPEVPTTVCCPICDRSDSWFDVDEYRHKPQGMKLCQNCGFVTYPEIVAKAEELKQHYRKEYRPGPNVQNLFTGQRKIHYHAHFLNDLFGEWKKEKLNCPDVFEVGAAFGMFLNFMRGNFPKARLSGSELTLTYRRVAYHEYGFQLLEDFDDSKKYDLIASYKVLEHQANPEKELRRYALALKDNGRLYISVPTWFHTMSNFGLDGFSLEYYYDKNHVNVWTRKLFETLLKKCGLEVVTANYVYYDSTYLCRRNDELMKEAPQFESPAEIIGKMGRIKKAAEFYEGGDFDNALKEFPAYPEAITAHYEKNRQKYDAILKQHGWEKFNEQVIAPALKACPDNHRIAFFAADLNMRYDRYAEALDHLNACLQLKPMDPATLSAVATCFRQLAQKAQTPKEALEMLVSARDACRDLNKHSLQFANDAITWMFADEARLPMPGEG
jgi:SAM-dependent methyltransferase